MREEVLSAYMQLGFDKASLLGHDIGGMVAMSFAQWTLSVEENPQDVIKAVLDFLK